MRRPHILSATIFCALAALIPQLVLAEPPSVIAIQDARIVTVSGPVIERGTVLIENGIIADVGAAVNVPKGAWVVDGKGMTVYPGFVDAFSTWGIPDAVPPAAPAGGRGAQTQAPAATPQMPAVRSNGPQDRPGTNSWVMAADLVKPTDKRIEAARGAGFTSAATFPRQGLIGGHGAVLNLGGTTPGQMILETPAGLEMNLTPSGYIGYPSSLMGVVAYFRQLWIDADYYKLSREMYAKSPASVPRPAYDRALEGVLATKRILLPAPGPVQLSRMLKLAAELKEPVVLYGVVQGYEMAAQLKQAGVPVVLNVKWPRKDRDSDPEAVESLRTLQVRERAPTSPAALASAGVRFGVSSDGIDNPRDVVKALKKSIDLGFKKEDAIRALTLSPAEIYGVAGRIGSVDKGKIANLVVANGDIFDDSTKVLMVFIDGVKYLPPIEAPPGPSGGPAGARPSETNEEDR
jgi:hypothetical protein